MLNATNDLTDQDKVSMQYHTLLQNKFKDSIQEAKRKDFNRSILSAARDFTMLLAFVAAVVLIFISVS